jgi:signal transduction histidine kinase
MNFDYVLLLIVFSYLRRALQSKILLPQIDKYLALGFWFSIGLLTGGIILDSSKAITAWIAHAMLFTLIYFCITQKEFETVKPFIYSLLPYIVVNFIEDFAELINSSFHEEWNNYFDTALFFSIVWIFAMFFISRKQRKEMEREQLRAVELEKEFLQSETLKAKLELVVAERTAEILGQKEKLQKALDKLKATQAQLIQSEKMASLGELTAGIAHEIQNPLNFVNNFSEVSGELLDEMNEEIIKGDFEEVKNIAADIKKNLEKINYHGKRADTIVKDMLQHSRASSGQKEPTDINKLADEYLRLAYHGLRAKDKSFNATITTDFDTTIGTINVIPQDMGRVILNLITNAFYAVSEKKKSGIEDYEPIVTIKTQREGNKVEVSVKDNGNGISQKILDKIFHPFFTTKPTGQGTGLGLSLSYDIVKAHNGKLKVKTKEGEGSEFVIYLTDNKL